MIQKLKSGTLSATELDGLSRSFFKMAERIAKRLAVPGTEDDCKSAAYHGIAYALKHVAKMYDDNLELWVKACIFRFVKQFQCTNHMICVPYSTLYRMKKRGEEFVPMKQNSLDSRDEKIQKSGRYTEMLECLETITPSNVDKKIICLRLDGYTDKEIGALINKSRAFVNKRRQIIERRFFLCLDRT